MLSLTAEYALRAVLYIADQWEAGPVRVEPMAAAMGLPRNYLAKTLNLLAKRGVLASQRGPAGGFRLASRPETITLATVVEGFDPGPTRRGCLLGRPRCNEDMPCPAHWKWKSVSEGINAFFRDTTVADLLSGPARKYADVSREAKRPILQGAMRRNSNAIATKRATAGRDAAPLECRRTYGRDH